MQLAQQSGESLQTYIMRLKTMSIDAEQAVREARTLQEHTLAAYKQAIADGATRDAVQGCADAILRASGQMARARKQRDDVEYELFEALLLWDV
jgi:hypothetical protein